MIQTYRLTRSSLNNPMPGCGYPCRTSFLGIAFENLTGYLIALACIVMCLGCTNSSERKSTHGDKRIKLALNWFPDSQHGGFYAAKLHGFYQAEGLDVEIMPGGPGTPVIQQLMLQRADFAVSNADQITEGNSKGSEVIAVMASLQNSPRCIMVHQSSGIRSFDQLNRDGLTLAIGSGRPFFKYLQDKIKLDKVNLVQYDGKVSSFVLNKNFAQQGYVFSEPFVLWQDSKPDS